MKQINFLKLISFFLLLSMVTISCEKDRQTDPASEAESGYAILKGDCSITMDLVAGQYSDVGDIEAAIVGNQLTVTYSIDPDLGFCLTETHLDVQLDPEDFPQNNNGNPKIGHFEYGDDNLGCATEWEQVIDLTGLGYSPGQTVYIAAHGVVQDGYGSLEAFESALPDCAYFHVDGGYIGGPAYMYYDITNGGILNGYHGAWCIDIGRWLSPGDEHWVNVYSSTEEIPDGVMDKPWNLPYVNWILNQEYVGQTSPGGYGTYNFGDVQQAIWYWVDNETIVENWYTFSQDRVDEIIAASLAAVGNDPSQYNYECGQYIGVILAPVDECGDNEIIGQVAIIPYMWECGSDETIWGGCLIGTNPPCPNVTQFNPNAGWAMYFDMVCP